MNNPAVPKLPKWPFFVADALLLGLALWIVSRQPHPLAPIPLALMVGCVIAAAFLGVWPFRLEYATAEKLAESSQLTSAVSEIQKLEGVANQVRATTGQWQTVEEHSTKAIAAAREIGDRMAAEAKAFSDFMQKANDSEKAHLRLEVEKLRRVETEWLHTVIRLLDHIFALQQAAIRSGQRSLIQQLTSFQDACREITRRVGLVPLEATAGEIFDGTRHQLMEGLPQPPEGASVEDTLATGYSFQGQFLRRTLVTLQSMQPGQPESDILSEVSPESTPDDPAQKKSEPTDALVADPAPEQAANNLREEPVELAEDPSFRLESDPLSPEETPQRRDA